MNDSKQRIRINLIAFFVVICGFIPGVRDALFRDLWFDEALTAGEFMSLPVSGIYLGYVIPNNQIIYTLCLKFWNELYPGNLSPDLYWRLFTVLCAAFTVAVICSRWRRRYGLLAPVLVLFAFCCSLPFEIYATAIRGYMLSMLWIVLSLEAARLWVLKPNWRTGTAYFIFSLLAVGTIPSNLLALAGIVIFLFPYFGFRKVLKWKFIYLAAAPLLAAALFYLPLSKRVAKIMTLHEGWESGFGVLRMVYSSFAIAFLPLLIAALAGSVIYFKKKKNAKFLWPLLILLIPVPVVFLRSPAPFPRVFVTMWPLWMLLLCAGLRHFLAFFRMRRKHLVAAGLLLAASIGWGMLCHNYSESLSGVFHRGENLDDFFTPYYMADDYKPWTLVQKVKEVSGKNEIPVYVTFNAEPCVLTLYGSMAGINPRRWLFDGPRGKIPSLPPGSWILLKTYELKRGELENIKKRFQLKTVVPLFENGVYSVFRAVK
jgi:hypothetical protein